MVIQSRISAFTDKYKPYLIIATLIVILILVGTFLSKKYRVSKAVVNNELSLSNNHVYQTDYCSPRLLPRKLVDFHIKSSHASLLSGLQKLDYASTDMLKNVIRNNVRYLEFSVFSKENNNEAEPVVSEGFKKGNWQFTANSVALREVFATIKDYAFNESVVNNYNDPVFIFLDIKTDYSGTLDQVADLILQMFGDRILDKRYRYQRKNLCDTSVCDLMDKIVIMSNNGFQNTKLEEFINISTSNGNLQRLEYTDVIVRKKFNVDAPDILFKSDKISFHSSIGVNYIKLNDYRADFRDLGLSKEYSVRISGSKSERNTTGQTLLSIDNITRDKISFKKLDTLKFISEEAGESEITINGYRITKLDAERDIVDMNKNTLTIVIPDNDLWSFNYNPRDIWFTGCHFVAMNYQTVDENLDAYQTFFAKRAIRLKGSSLLNELTASEERGIKSSSKLLNIAPKLDIIYPVNYDFIKNNIDNPVEFNTLLNSNLFLQFYNPDTPLKIGLKSTESKFTFTCELSPNKRHKNSLHIILIHDGERYYLGKYGDKSRVLTFKRKTSDIENFIEKTSFLPLAPLCRKDDFTSFGYVNRENINGTSVDILYYLKYRPNFSIRNKLYTTLTNNYKKLGKIAFKYNDGKTVKTAHFYRPLRSGEYRPLGDIIINEGEYSASRIQQLNGELPIYEVKTAIVNGGVKSPLGYTEVYNNGDLVKGDEPYFSIWKPKPPDGYIALGNVIKFERGNSAPSRELIWCVRADLVESTEYTQDTDSSVRRLSNEWFNSQIGLWTKYNPSGINTMRYFTSSYNVDSKSGVRYEREYTDATPLELQEPSELDNPVYDIRDFRSFTEDNIILESQTNTGKDRDACCFKVSQSYKSGEFTEYNLYNNLSDVVDNDYKAVSYEPDRNGRSRCLNVPYSYWSDYYKELNPVSGIPLRDKMKKSIFLKHTRDYSGETDYFTAKLPTDKKGCRNLTDQNVNSITCEIDVGRDQNISNKYYINKLESCPSGSKVANVKLVTDVSSCVSMGGNPSAKRGVAECNFEVCDNVFNNQSLVIPLNNEDTREACEGYNYTDGYFLMKNKNDCEALGGEYNDKTGYCKKTLCYNPTPVKSQVHMGGCREPDYFGTNFTHKADNTIRLKNNSKYCLSVDLEENGRVKDKSVASIKECDPEKIGQQFVKTQFSGLQYKSSDYRVSTSENVCLTAGLDNSVKLDKCNPLQNSQRWSLEEMPRSFCMSAGSRVYYLDKSTFVRKSKAFPGNAINVPVENLLQEEYDYNNIHAYVSAKIVSINKDNSEVLYIPDNKGIRRFNEDKPIKISLKDATEMFILDFAPPRERLQLGARVIVKNGALNYNTEPFINLTDDEVKFFGVIVEDLGSDNYKVFMSINSIEPNRKNKSFGRPDYSQVKSVNIKDIVLLKKPPIC